MCSGVPLCARHSTGVYLSDSLRPTSEIVARRCLGSADNHDTADAVDSSGYPWRPRLSGGCSAGVEQSATRNSGLLLTFDISKGDQVSPFPSVSRTADLALSTQTVSKLQSTLSSATVKLIAYKLCKVLPQLLWWRNYNLNICSGSSSISINMCVCMSVCLSVCMYVCLHFTTKLAEDISTKLGRLATLQFHSFLASYFKGARSKMLRKMRRG